MTLKDKASITSLSGGNISSILCLDAMVSMRTFSKDRSWLNVITQVLACSNESVCVKAWGWASVTICMVFHTILRVKDSTGVNFKDGVSMIVPLVVIETILSGSTIKEEGYG